MAQIFKVFVDSFQVFNESTLKLDKFYTPVLTVLACFLLGQALNFSNGIFWLGALDRLTNIPFLSWNLVLSLIFGPFCEIRSTRDKFKLNFMPAIVFKVFYNAWLPMVYSGLVYLSVVDFEYPDVSWEFLLFVGVIGLVSLIPVLIGILRK